MNHLEQLVAEWYEYQGYFVRKNIKVDPRPNGGYNCELDVVAFNPETKKIVHIEPSSDAMSWAKREERYLKKFEAGRKYIPDLFPSFEIRGDKEQIALFLFGSKSTWSTIAGGKVQLVSELMIEICEDLSLKSVAKKAVPEQFALLRTIQLSTEYRKLIYENYQKKNLI
jgi:hypothetical protein